MAEESQGDPEVKGARWPIRTCGRDLSNLKVFICAETIGAAGFPSSPKDDILVGATGIEPVTSAP